jgi:hypothetical protein
MDPNALNSLLNQRLNIAQDLVGQLVSLLSLPIQPPRTSVQQVLSAAADRVKALEAQQAGSNWNPLQVPQLAMPAGAVAAPAAQAATTATH